MKTVFTKSVAVYLIIILVTFILIGLGLSNIYNTKFYTDQKKLLVGEAVKIADVYKSSHKKGYAWDLYEFEADMHLLNKYLDNSYIITDKDLYIMLTSDDIDSSFYNTKLDNFTGYTSILSGNLQWLTGNFNNLFAKKMYILGYPLLIDGRTEGIVFVSTPLDNLSSNVNKSNRIIIVFLILAFFLGFFLVSYALNKILLPLKEINYAAKRISEGNFNERIIVNQYNEMAELCSSFNQMAESLYTQDKNRREFISNISHDIRSPLTSMLGFLEALIDGTIPEEKYPKYFKTIYREATRLNKLSSSLTNFDNISKHTAPESYTNFNINELVTDVSVALQGRAEKKGIEIKCLFEEDCLISFANKDNIQRVLYNLVHNAVKFTEKGIVTISTTSDIDLIYVTVKDTGIGLAQSEQKKVFDRLYKADSTRNIDKTGSGLGLSIVKEIINSHNQEIFIESEPNVGTKFTFTLNKSN